MNNKEVADLVNLALSDKNYVIDKLLPVLRLTKRYILSEDPGSKSFNRAINRLNQAIDTATFMRCRK